MGLADLCFQCCHVITYEWNLLGKCQWMPCSQTYQRTERTIQHSGSWWEIFHVGTLFLVWMTSHGTFDLMDKMLYALKSIFSFWFYIIIRVTFLRFSSWLSHSLLSKPHRHSWDKEQTLGCGLRLWVPTLYSPRAVLCFQREPRQTHTTTWLCLC